MAFPVAFKQRLRAFEKSRRHWCDMGDDALTLSILGDENEGMFFFKQNNLKMLVNDSTSIG